LRAIALELLGYPKDLIRKGKDLIYRYTVYTPQEEMKQILYENKDVRLDALRKVFNIDKYKRIRENSRLIIISLREKKKHLEGFVLDLEYKRRDLEERKNEIFDIDKKISDISPKIEELKNIIANKKKAIEDIEDNIRELNLLKKELSSVEASLNHKIEQNNRLNDEIKKLDMQIAELNVELESKSLSKLETIQYDISQKEKEINEAELKYKNVIRKTRELEVKIEHCNDTIKKIQELDVCPVCEQKVNEGHKHSIGSREIKKTEELIKQIEGQKEEEAKLEKIRIQLKKDLDALTREQNHLNITKIKIQNLNEKSGIRDERTELKERIKKEIGILNSRKLDLNSEIEKYSQTEETYKVMKKEMEGLLPQERFLDLEKRKYETEKAAINRFILNLEKEINEKQKAKEKLTYLSQLMNWIDEFFINLMSNMEKHVMVNIHSQFDELFRNWFDIIMEDEAISVRVDEEFTPVIEQNGYETYIENLSGGEKTSVALSYRLALNKVINDVVADIKTKEIIMLDEPTDGFSSEQLDKVRDVLDQLNMKQVIIVSHESKIESFVQNVVRVEKRDNVSVVV